MSVRMIPEQGDSRMRPLLTRVMTLVFSGSLLFSFSQAATVGLPDDDNSIDLISVVLLQREVPEFSDERIAGALEKAWGRKLRTGADAAETSAEYVVRRDPGYVIQTRDARYLVIISSRPYVSEEDIEAVTDLRLRPVLREHRAWISVDLLSLTENQNRDMIRKTHLPLMAKLAAELTTRQTLGVIVPSEEIVLPRTDDLVTLLRSPDPTAALRAAGNIPVLKASDEDPRLKAATEEARRTFPVFTKAFRSQDQGTSGFGVKFPFAVGERKEFMWVRVTQISDTTVTGHLANEPVLAKGLRLGDEVTQSVAEISDWMYLKDSEIVGGFTIRALTQSGKSDSAN